VKPKKPIMLVYHKPRGVICTMDRRVEDNLVDAVNFPERVFNVGRLDRFSEGLLLLTNMGEAVNRILRARYGHEKEYIVDYSNEVSDEAIRRMSRGLEILGRPTLPCQIDRLTSKRLRIVLTEGRNRQIRRMAEAVDLHVSRLRRVRVMHIKLGTLPAGEYRHLSAPEFEELEARLLAAEALPAPHYEIASDDDDED